MKTSKVITVWLSREDHSRLKELSASLGFTLAGFSRKILRDSLKPRAKPGGLQTAVRPLVRVIAEGLGRTTGASNANIEALYLKLLAAYEAEVSKVPPGPP